MKAAVLYSGGKDSTLMAFLLQRMGYQVKLVTMNFGIYPSYQPARESAHNLGFAHQTIKADVSLMETAVSMIIKDGFPNRGIDFLHLKSLELVSEKFKVVADGTRRDDRVPKPDQNTIRSFEDRKDAEYINLAGFGHKTINNLVEKIFKIKKEPTSFQNNSDYEIEIRCLINELEGREAAEKLFPPHIQSRVIGWK